MSFKCPFKALLQGLHFQMSQVETLKTQPDTEFSSQLRVKVNYLATADKVWGLWLWLISDFRYTSNLFVICCTKLSSSCLSSVELVYHEFWVYRLFFPQLKNMAEICSRLPSGKVTVTRTFYWENSAKSVTTQRTSSNIKTQLRPAAERRCWGEQTTKYEPCLPLFL